jgi:zinc D-Ala-D-Ala carboxypeptidase
MYMQKLNRKGRLAVVVLAAVVILAIWLAVRPDAPPESGTGPTSTQSSQTAPPPSPSFDKHRLSLSAPDSPWVIANKRRPLSPVEFVPQLATPAVPLRLSSGSPEMQLSVQAIPALEQLFAAAKADGLDLMLASGYRSYGQQIAVYDSEVRRFGQDQADRESARPGHSEHQTGLAADVEPASRKCEIIACFGDLPEGKWVAANAHRFGFIIRYAQGSEPVTGYTYEPWHLRFVGKELATELYEQGNPPLETFFDLAAAPDYQ